MTFPTLLTLLRIPLAFLVMAAIFAPGWPAKAVALGLFLLASMTDWLDGYLARRWRQTSPLGALLDPIADKVLILGTFLALVQLAWIPAWMVLIIVLREFLITGVRLVAASRHVVLAAERAGKQKLVSQVLTIVVILAVLLIQALVGPEAIAPAAGGAMDALIQICLWITMGLTVVSGAVFLWRHRTVLSGGR